MTSVEGDQPLRGVVAKMSERGREPTLAVGEVSVHLLERFEHGLDPVVVGLVHEIRCR